MKWVLVLGFVAFSTLGFSWQDDLPADANVELMTWCEGDVVTEANELGQSVGLWDCSDIGEQSRCVEKTEIDGEWTVVTATCQ